MSRLKLALLWHMHQPDYRDYDTNEFTMPWVYLHAIKDYTDMAYHLEVHPQVKAIVNFVPILLDQLEDYTEQFNTQQIRDPLLRLLTAPDLDQISPSDRQFIFNRCFQSNHTTMLQPYPAFKRLHDLYDTLHERGESELVYFSGQYLADLLVWYHLAWTGESVRRHNDTVMKLMAQSNGFSFADRAALFNLIGELIQGIIPRYRNLAESGQIELTTTPYYHPISPLLLDFSCAHDTLPDDPLPMNPKYPGGRERVVFHVTSAIESHTQRFGVKPSGIWPAEGAVSSPFLDILAAHQCQWCASGEQVLANSLRKSYPDQSLPDRSHYLYYPYRIEGTNGSLTCFFRDDKLSDLIGFEYAKWFGHDAAQNFIQYLEKISHEAPSDDHLIVSVILDGENAWESYPYNGYYFLDDLYTMLEKHADIATTTYQEYLTTSEYTNSCTPLPTLAAGSWVYGTLSTWIGDPEKNRAWDLLCAAKQSYDLVIHSERLTDAEKKAACQQLGSCESSDWFWWFGDYNPAQAVASFDQLYRKDLSNLYQLLKLPVPASLHEPISKGDSHAEGDGAMRRSS